jgi:GNAT superfamily N-acetyltransferase
MIAGLAFRTLMGNEDIPKLVETENACWKEDLIDAVITVEDMENDIKDPFNMDPYKDMIIAEVEGKYAGHSIVNWLRVSDECMRYFLYAYLTDEWRGRGLRELLVRRSEERLRVIAHEHPKGITKYIETYSHSEKNDWRSVLEREGYSPSWHLFEMVRPDLDDIPDLSLPVGVEVRRVKPEHYKIIWEAMKEALRDERSFSEDKYGDVAFEKELKEPIFSPELWQIAWAGGEVVGGVHNYINRGENKAFGRKWGHTERIFVARGWRKKGIARALITRSLKVLKDQGMEAATLDVDTENPSGALRVYESLGYRPTEHFVFFRKSLE